MEQFTKINIMSDLHLDASNISHDTTGFDIIVLAGDTSVDPMLTKEFVTRKINEETKIVFVAGNHEFDHKGFLYTLDFYKEMENTYENFYFLYDNTVNINNIKFIGTTLWTNFEGSGKRYKHIVKEWAKINIPDIRTIWDLNHGKKVSWDPDRVEEEFNKNLDFLNRELYQNKKEEEINFVVTHFAPNRNSVVPKFKSDIYSSYWVNNLEDSLVSKSDYWVHGHIHESVEYNVGQSQIICNPRGFSRIFDLSQNPIFDKDKSIAVPKGQLNCNIERRKNALLK